MKGFITLAAVIVLTQLSTHCMGQAFFSKMSKAQKVAPSKSPVATVASASLSAVLPAAPGAPTITTFSPKFAGADGTVDITGTNFENGMTVSFGGTPAALVSVRSATEAIATVGNGANGSVTVTTTRGTDNKAGFTFVAAPTITSVDHDRVPAGTRITITGTNFIGPCQIAVNGGPALPAAVFSATSIAVTVPGKPVITDVEVTTPGGVIDFSAVAPTQGNVDLNLPNFTDGLVPIPTPSFDLNQVTNSNNFGFSERFWGNSLGLDSSRSRAGSKFLSPDISVFGFKGEFDWRWTNNTSKFAMGMVLEANLLSKKLSYIDTASKGSTAIGFNPFVFHPRLGITSSFFSNNFYAGLLTNFMTVIGHNDEFAAFFHSGSKNVFVYPEIDLGGLIPIGSGTKQALKFEFNLIINNGDAQFMTGISHDPVIPFLKIGYVTGL